MLFSKIVALRTPTFESTRNSVIEITATGIEALTVRPTFKTRYSEDAPKMIPSNVPTIRARGVNSSIATLGGMNGRKFVRYGLSGFQPVRSGNSCARAASDESTRSVDIKVS